MTKRFLHALSCAAALMMAMPAAAQPVAPAQPLSAAERAVPAQLTVAERGGYRRLFADIEAGRLQSARGLLAALPDTPLKAVAEAQLILAQGSGRAIAGPLDQWLVRNADLPQAPNVLRLLGVNGRSVASILPESRPLRLVAYSYSPGRPTVGAAARAEHLADAMRPLLADDRPRDAEAVWRSLQASVASEARSEWAQRTAWIYYLAGDDAGAARMGALAGAGGGKDCQRAGDHFDVATAKAQSAELQAAAAYWASRAHLACGRPELVSARLYIAASHGDGFYALLARRTLGIDYALDWSEPDFIQADWNHLAKLPAARRAAALVEIGQLGLADRELRHLAAIADPVHYDAIMRLAARLNLPATQYWLSQRSPTGAPSPLAARFPAPDWTPYRGWRVDQALVFAHALQESHFVTDAVSRVGARGVMQLMPGTARKLSADIGTEHDMDRLKDPSFNIEYGQTYLEELRDSVWTQGLLPKVIAAYNAGPGSVKRWNETLRDNGDPLLFIESIPFRETRHYVEVVLRNYWMYQLRMGETPQSIDALAAGLWPRFPGLPGATAVRLETTLGALASAD